MSGPQEYLGDSVYAFLMEDELVLTTNNGAGPTNTIYLDRIVCRRLLQFISETGLCGDGSSKESNATHEA